MSEAETQSGTPKTSGAPKSGEYQDGKLWFTRKASIVTIGITSLGSDQIGDVERVELPDEGDDFDKGDALATIEGSMGTLEVTTPAAGVVSEINEGLKEEPGIVSEDPLEEGWLVKVEIQDPTDLSEYAGG